MNTKLLSRAGRLMLLLVLLSLFSFGLQGVGHSPPAAPPGLALAQEVTEEAPSEPAAAEGAGVEPQEPEDEAADAEEQRSENDEAEEEPADESDADKPGELEEPEKPDTAKLNLNNANVDQIIKFLRDHTGKVVVKSKDVQAQISIAAPEPMAPERAVQLIYSALRLEGVSIVEMDDVIHLVTAEQAAMLGVETRMFDLQYADVESLQELIKPLIDEKTKVLADTRSNKLVITGSADTLSKIGELIGQLDVLEIEGTQVEIFQLQHAEAAEVAPILEAILLDEGQGRQRGGQQRRPQEGAAVAVVAYAAANWVVVRAPKEKLEAARGLIERLDREKPPDLKLNVVNIQNAEASELARTLSDLLRKRPRTKQLSETVEITADDRSNALIIMSTPENYELVRGIIGMLDTEESQEMQTRSYALQYSDAEDVASQLNDLYAGSGGGRSGYYYFYRRSQEPQTQFVAERRTNTLIVIAPPEDFEQIEALIEQLDQTVDQDEISPRIYHIENVDAKEMTDVLNQIFGIEDTQQRQPYWFYRSRAQGDDQVGRLYGKVRFVQEPSTNSVIVITNNAENFSIIEDLLQRLDRAMPEYANTMVYELEHADAVELADQLNTLFAPPGAGGQRGREEEDAGSAYVSWLMGTRRGQEDERPISNLIGKVRVVPDPRINALLITTSVQHRNVLEQLIKQLDVESPKVLLRVRLIEVTRSDESRKGVRWTSDSTIFETQDFNSGLLANFGFEWSEVTRDSVLTADIDLSNLIQFMEREFGADIVSEPTLAVNNNREATIFVGAEVPFITETQREPGTTARNDSFEYRDVGTKLVITPHINKNNKVVTTMQIEQSQTRPGEVLFGGFILDTRQFNSELAVDDGQTIVIGGIFRRDEQETINRVPVLGHIPVIKPLFSKRDTSATTTELIAFITPTVMRTAADVDEVTRRESSRLEGLEDLCPKPGAELPRP